MLVFPMIVVEENTNLEIRDAYLRAIRKDKQSSEENLSPGIKNAILKSQMDCEEIGILVEP